MRHLQCVLFLSFVSFTLLPLSGLSAQQTGRVTGQVLGEAGNPLGGAAVSVVRGQRGIFTAADGTYSLELPAGTHTLQARLIGYRTTTAEVTVRAGETSTLDFALAPDPLGMRELVVTATREPVIQQEATLSVTLVPAERIQKFQPQSVAEVLRTVPGIHAEEGGGEVAVNSFLRGLPSPGQFRTRRSRRTACRSAPSRAGSSPPRTSSSGTTTT